MDNTMNITYIYGVTAVLSLILACAYCAMVHKKEICLMMLYISVFIANMGYFALSISKTLEEALLANRIAYLGNIFLPLFILMTILKVCRIDISKGIIGILISFSVFVFLVVASQGYLPFYYREVSLEFVNGMAKLNKVYGPLHKLYFVYLFAYFAGMLGVIFFAFFREKMVSYKHVGVLAVVVFFNLSIWLIEQLIEWDFEFLSVSYIAGELLLLFLYGMIQDYESLLQQKDTALGEMIEKEPGIGLLEPEWPEIGRLSAREKDVLEKLFQNKRRKEIADELYITENTVKKHISSIFIKLEVENRSELFEKKQNITKTMK